MVYQSEIGITFVKLNKGKIHKSYKKPQASRATITNLRLFPTETTRDVYK